MKITVIIVVLLACLIGSYEGGVHKDAIKSKLPFGSKVAKTETPVIPIVAEPTTRPAAAGMTTEEASAILAKHFTLVIMQNAQTKP